MNTTNEQTSNLNSDFQDANLTNSGSKKFSRDYDKEPLVLRDYSREMLIHDFLNLIFFLIYFIFALVIQDHIKFGQFDEIIRKIRILFLVLVGFLFISYLITIFLKERYVLLSNDLQAIYYDNDLKIRKIYSLIGGIEFSSFLYTIPSEKFMTIYPILILSIGGFIFTFDSEFIVGLFIYVFVLFLAIIYDILFRMLLYKKSNENLTNFWKYSQKFVIRIGWDYGIRIVTVGATICFFNQKDHDLLKEYFLIKFHVNLDMDIKGVESIKFF